MDNNLGLKRTVEYYECRKVQSVISKVQGKKFKAPLNFNYMLYLSYMGPSAMLLFLVMCRLYWGSELILR